MIAYDQRLKATWNNENTFHARVRRSEVRREILWARTRPHQFRIGRADKTFRPSRTLPIQLSNDGRRAADISVVPRHAMSQFHAPEQGVVNDNDLIQVTTGAERVSGTEVFAVYVKRKCA